MGISYSFWAISHIFSLPSIVHEKSICPLFLDLAILAVCSIFITGDIFSNKPLTLICYGLASVHLQCFSFFKCFKFSTIFALVGLGDPDSSRASIVSFRFSCLFFSVMGFSSFSWCYRIIGSFCFITASSTWSCYLGTLRSMPLAFSFCAPSFAFASSPSFLGLFEWPLTHWKYISPLLCPAIVLFLKGVCVWDSHPAFIFPFSL